MLYPGSMQITRLTPNVSTPRPMAGRPTPPPPDDFDRFQPQHPAIAFQERAGRVIDKACDLVGMSLSVAGCALVGSLAGSLLGPVGFALGGLSGGVAGGLAYSKGYGDLLGKSAMAAASVGVGAALGSLGGPTGAAIGAGLGATYAGLGLYFSRE